MDKNELLRISEIPEEQLPLVISEQFQNIKNIDRKIKGVEYKIKIAKESAEKIQNKHLLVSKETINTTQNSIKAVVEAQTTLAEAQKLLFELQQRMSEGMRFLLLLGAENVAMNKRVVSELEMQLKNASQEELSEERRKELIGVISLLREQENAFNKQSEILEIVSNNTNVINEHENKIIEINKIDELQDEKDKVHDKLIDENSKTNNEQDIKLKKLDDTDLTHNQKIKQSKDLAVFGIILSCIAIILSIIALLV